MSNTERRPQRQKAVPQRVQRVQNIRSSGAAGIHSGQGEYERMNRGKLNQLVWEELEDSWDYGYSNDEWE